MKRLVLPAILFFPVIAFFGFAFWGIRHPLPLINQPSQQTNLPPAMTNRPATETH